jgi:hypothetical protein
VTGYRGGGPHGLARDQWTDDTSMALALAASIASVGWDLNDQTGRYVRMTGDGRIGRSHGGFSLWNWRSARTKYPVLPRFRPSTNCATGRATAVVGSRSSAPLL